MWTPSTATELKLMSAIYLDLITFSQHALLSGRFDQVRANPTDKSGLPYLTHRLSKVLAKVLIFMEQNIRINQIVAPEKTNSSSARLSAAMSDRIMGGSSGLAQMITSISQNFMQNSAILDPMTGQQTATGQMNIKQTVATKALEEILESKRKTCLKLLETSRRLLVLNNNTNQQLQISIINSDLFTTYLRMLTACAKFSPECRSQIVETGLLSSLLRTRVIRQDINHSMSLCKPEGGEALRLFLIAVVEDSTLIEKCIESEVKYFFYSLKKKNEQEANARPKSKEEGSASSSKLEINDEFPYSQFLKKFAHVANDHPESFVKVVNKLCFIQARLPTETEEVPRTTAQRGDRPPQQMLNPDNPVNNLLAADRGRQGGRRQEDPSRNETGAGNREKTGQKVKMIKLSAPLKDTQVKQELSETTRKAVGVLLTEIMITSLKELGRCVKRSKEKDVSVEQNSQSKRYKDVYLLSPKILMEIALNKVLVKYPILHVLIQNMNFAKTIEGHCNEDFLSRLFTPGEPIKFVGFFMKAALVLNPKLLNNLWKFTTNSPVLVYRHRRIVSIQSLFRMEIIEVVRTHLQQCTISLVNLLKKSPTSAGLMDEESKSDVSQQESELKFLMASRSNAEVLIQLFADFNFVKEFLQTQEGSELSSMMETFELLSHLDVSSLSQHNKLLNLFLIPLALIAKYVAVFSANRSAVDGVDKLLQQAETHMQHGSAPHVSQELSTPDTLTLNWDEWSQQVAAGSKEGIFLTRLTNTWPDAQFGSPEIIVSDHDLEQVRKTFAKAMLGKRGDYRDPEFLQMMFNQDFGYGAAAARDHIAMNMGVQNPREDDSFLSADNQPEEQLQIDPEEAELYYVEEHATMEAGEVAVPVMDNEMLVLEHQGGTEPVQHHFIEGTDVELDSPEDLQGQFTPHEELNDQITTLVEKAKISLKYPHSPETGSKLRKSNLFIRDPQIETSWRKVQEIHHRMMLSYTVLDNTQGIASGLMEFEQISSMSFLIPQPLLPSNVLPHIRGRESLRNRETALSTLERHIQLLQALSNGGGELRIPGELDDGDDLLPAFLGGELRDHHRELHPELGRNQLIIEDHHSQDRIQRIMQARMDDMRGDMLGIADHRELRGEGPISGAQVQQTLERISRRILQGIRVVDNTGVPDAPQRTQSDRHRSRSNGVIGRMDEEQPGRLDPISLMTRPLPPQILSQVAGNFDDVRRNLRVNERFRMPEPPQRPQADAPVEPTANQPPVPDGAIPSNPLPAANVVPDTIARPENSALPNALTADTINSASQAQILIQADGSGRLDVGPQLIDDMDQQQDQQAFNFRAMGLPDNFLEVSGIDREFFTSLPYEMQMEVVMQNMHENFEAFSQPRAAGRAQPNIAEGIFDPVPIPPAQTRVGTNNNTTNNTNNNTANNTGNNTGQNSPRRLSTGLQIGAEPMNAEPALAENQRPQLAAEVAPGSLAASLPRPQPSPVAAEAPVELPREAVVEVQLVQPQHPQPAQQSNNQAPQVAAPPAPVAAPPAPVANDNEVFLNTLTPEMREEVLMTCPDEFLQGMPQAIVDEARVLRDNANNGGLRNPFLNAPGLRGGLNYTQYLGNDLFGARDARRAQRQPPQKVPKKKVLTVDPKIAVKMFPITQDTADGFIKLLSYPKGLESFNFTLLASLCANPDNEQKIFRALHRVIETKGETPGLLVRPEKLTLSCMLVMERLTLSFTSYFGLKQDSTSLGLCEMVSKMDEERVSAFDSFMTLISDYRDEPNHVTVLLKILHNVVELNLEQAKPPKTEEICRVELSPQRAKELSEVLYFKKSNEQTIKALGSLVSLFCLNDANLKTFIEELTQSISSLCTHLNEQLGVDISLLKEYLGNKTDAGLEMIEFLVSKRQGKQNFSEVRFLKVFNLVSQLYEKSLERAQKMSEETQSGSQPPQPAAKVASLASSPAHPNEGSTSPKKTKEEEWKGRVCEEVRLQFNVLMNNQRLVNLWLNICESLSLLEQIFEGKDKILGPIIVGMKPLLESFFIKYKILCDDETVNKIMTLMKKQSNSKDNTKKQMSNLQMDEESQQHEDSFVGFSYDKLRETHLGINELFVLMCEKNRTAINRLISQDMNLLFDSMSVIPKKLPKVLDFDNKKTYFRLSLDRAQKPHYQLNLSVRREEIFADSFNQIISKQPFELKGKMQVEFKGEEGVDAGGVAREWFLELSKKIFDPSYCLFIPSASGATYQPSPISSINTEHIRYFKFIGRVIGKALHDGYLMDAFFTRAFYKHMNGTPLSYEDMEDIDPDYYKNLKWVLENDVTDFGIVFSYQADNLGALQERELIEGGSKIPVTNENKKEYIKLVCYDKMARTIKDQIEAFLDGLHDLIPKDLLKIFDPKELELMLSGLPEIDSKQLGNFSKRFEDKHGIPHLHEGLSSHQVVLGDPGEFRQRDQGELLTVRDRDVQGPCRWLQESAGYPRCAEVPNTQSVR